MSRLGLRLENAAPFALSPVGSGSAVPPWTLAEIQSAAVIADELGYESIWSPEGNTRDALTMLTALALATNRIGIGTGVLSIYARAPTVTAMSAASLDVISEGRFSLGLGVSHQPMVVNGLGIPFDRPFTRMRENVGIAKRLFAGETFSYEGTVYRPQNISLGFPPHRHDLPIYVAALRPKMVTLAGEIADGVFLNFISADYLRQATQLIADGARSAGRDPNAIDVVCFVRVAVTNDFDRTRPALQRLLSGRITLPYYRMYFESLGFEEECRTIMSGFANNDPLAAASGVSDRLIHELVIVGTASECNTRLNRLRGLGLKMPIIAPAPIGDDPLTSYLDTVQALAP